MIGGIVSVMKIGINTLLNHMRFRKHARNPMIFKQTRIGKDGVPFTAYKFRTMPEGTTTHREQDATRIGKWLRRWSLDELPQLWNILTGDMALIGPRPMLPHQAMQLIGWQKLRLSVKPGITGYAQVMGRNAIPWSKRIEYDVWYVQHRNWKLDCWILWRTLVIWWTKEGLYGPQGVNEDRIS